LSSFTCRQFWPESFCSPRQGRNAETRTVPMKAPVLSLGDSATVDERLVIDRPPPNRSRCEKRVSWIAGRAISRVEPPSCAAETDWAPATCTPILANYAGVEVASQCGSSERVAEDEDWELRLSWSRLSDNVSRHGLSAFYAVVCDIPIIGSTCRAFPAQRRHRSEWLLRSM